MKHAYMWGTFASMFMAVFATHFKNTYKDTLKKSDKRLYLLFAFLAFIPLTFISAVRYDIGSDFQSYAMSFADGGTEFRYTEPGFFYYIQAIKHFTDNPQVFFAVTSILLGAAYYWLIFKESESPVYSILLYLLTRDYFCSMNSIRQFFAMAILMMAIPLMRKGKWRWVLVLPITALAYTFHTTLLCVIPLYLLFLLNLSPWTSGFLVFASYVLPRIAIDFVKNSVELLTRFGKYVENLEPGFEASTFLTFFCLLAMTAVFVQKIDRKDSQTRLFYNANVFGLSALAFAGSVHWAAIRLCYFANPFIVVYLPHVMKKIKPTWLRVIGYIGISLCFFVVCNFVTLSGNQTVLGYHTFWQV